MAKPGSRVRCIYAFVTVDDDGDEALALIHSADGWVPMVTLDKERLPALREIAREMQRQFPNVRVELRRYEMAGVAEVIGKRVVTRALEMSNA